MRAHMVTAYRNKGCILTVMLEVLLVLLQGVSEQRRCRREIAEMCDGKRQ